MFTILHPQIWQITYFRSWKLFLFAIENYWRTLKCKYTEFKMQIFINAHLNFFNKIWVFDSGIWPKMNGNRKKTKMNGDVKNPYSNWLMVAITLYRSMNSGIFGYISRIGNFSMFESILICSRPQFWIHSLFLFFSWYIKP